MEKDRQKKLIAALVAATLLIIIGFGVFISKRATDGGQDQFAEQSEAKNNAPDEQFISEHSEVTPLPEEGLQAQVSPETTTSSPRVSNEAVAVVNAPISNAESLSEPHAEVAQKAAPTGFFKSILGVFKGFGGATKTAGTDFNSAPGSEIGSLAPDHGDSRQVASLPTPPPAPPAPCVSANFSPNSKKLTDEEFTQHRHVLRLAHEEINSKTVCVRVNGRPVKHQLYKGKSDQLLIGPVASSSAKIQVRYCFGKNTCNENCSVPKDDFMEAIGAGGDDENLPVAKWSADDDTTDGLAVVDDEMKRELAAAEDMAIFSGWEGDEVVPSCRAQRASMGQQTPEG